MKIQSIQKVIKVGSSLAVTIPARDARYYNIKAGDELKTTIEVDAIPGEKDVEIVALTQKLIMRHSKALGNLSQR